MVIPVSTENDWRFIEDREPVKFYPKIRDGVPPDGPLVIEEAKRTAPTKDEIENDVDLARYGIIWTVWRNQLNGVEPKYGDVFEVIQEPNSGYKYTIKAVQLLSLRQRYRCQCLKVR